MYSRVSKMEGSLHLRMSTICAREYDRRSSCFAVQDSRRAGDGCTYLHYTAATLDGHTHPRFSDPTEPPVGLSVDGTGVSGVGEWRLKGVGGDVTNVNGMSTHATTLISFTCNYREKVCRCWYVKDSRTTVASNWYSKTVFYTPAQGIRSSQLLRTPLMCLHP